MSHDFHAYAKQLLTSVVVTPTNERDADNAVLMQDVLRYYSTDARVVDLLARAIEREFHNLTRELLLDAPVNGSE